MPVTFVRTTDRPRLFDDRPSPRARRPARRTDRDRAPLPDRDRTPNLPDPATPSFDFASPPASPPAPATPEVQPDGSPAIEPATPGFDLAPADADHLPHGHEPTSSGAARDAHTLDHLISGVWDELSAHRTVSCPVCHGQMAPRYGSAELPVGGRCRRCGSTLG